MGEFWAKILVLLLAMTCAVFFFTDKPVAQVKLDEQSFTQAYIKRAAERFPNVVVRMDGPLTLRAKSGDNAVGEITISLDNAYLTYKSSDEPIDQILDRFMTAMLSPPPSDSFVRRANLLPAVRTEQYVKDLTAITSEGERKQELAHLPYAPGLAILLYFDGPESLRFANWEDVKNLGLTRDEAMATALENLTKLKIDATVTRMDVVTVVEVSGAVGSGLLLHPKFWEREDFVFSGDLVVFPMSRDMLLATGSTEIDGLRLAREFVSQNFSELPYALIATPLVRRKGEWQAFE